MRPRGAGAWMPVWFWPALAVELALVLGLAVALWLPAVRDAAGLRRQIEAREGVLAEAGALAPVAAELDGLEAALPEVGEVPQRTPLPLEAVGRLPEVFAAMAAPFGLRLVTAAPDPGSAGLDGAVAMRLALEGDPDKFRSFLLALGNYGPLTGLESVSTEVQRNVRGYGVTCWLAVQ